MTGANSLSEILAIRNEIIDLCKLGGLNIRQWASNHQYGLDNIHEKLFNSENVIDKNSVINTLGLFWKSIADSFIYTSERVNSNIIFNKRNIFRRSQKFLILWDCSDRLFLAQN